MSTSLAAPAVTVELDGALLAGSASGALVSLRVDQVLSAPARLELCFADPPGPVDALARLRPGAAMAVRIAEEPTLIEADVSAVEHRFTADGDRQVVVRGCDRLHRLRSEQRSVVHVDEDLEALARRLAAPAGLDVVCDEPPTPVAHLLQCQRTDLDLLRTEAEQLGLHLVVRGRTLHVLPLSGHGSPVPLRRGEDLLDVTVEVADGPAPVRVRGWDPATAAEVAGDAEVPQVTASPSSGRAERWLTGLPLRDDRHAAGRARAALERAAADSLAAEGTAVGSARLQPGVRISLRGLEPDLQGPYAITTASHRLDASEGYVTSFSTRPPQRPPIGNSGNGEGLMLTLGVVVAVDDPAGAGRIRVSLTALEGLETDWLGVVSAGAGAGKGMVATPDVEDRVAVLVSRRDPGLGMVLGGLFGMEAPPEAGLVDGRIRRTSVITAGGLRVVLSDDQQTLRLEDGSGSHVQLGPDGVELHAARPLDIAAPGQPVRIRGSRIDFERA